MATKQIKDYSAKTALDSTDQFLIQESGDTTKKTTTAELGILDGWIPVAETWTYASADDPTFTFTITGDYTARYSVGMKIKLTQTTVKYFIITAISYSDPSTTVTVYGGTDYDLADAAITLPNYSMVKAPYGFPMSPTKWTETFTDGTDRYQTNPTASTYYGGGNTWTSGSNITVTANIGAWDIDGYLSLGASKTGAVVNAVFGLSASSSTISGAIFAFTNYIYDASRITSYFNNKILRTSKATYYLLGQTATASVTDLRIYEYSIKLICAYL
jgi:hypothetical protein